MTSSEESCENSIFEEYLKIEREPSKLDFKRDSVTDFSLLDFREEPSALGNSITESKTVDDINSNSQNNQKPTSNVTKTKSSFKDKLTSITCNII